MPIGSLGRTGSIVPSHALGTKTFGVETNELEAHRMLDLYVARGGTFIDTADVYLDGVPEEIIGRWGAARGRTDDFVVATKRRLGPFAGQSGRISPRGPAWRRQKPGASANG
ncbi:hypothetical protein P775_11985 [Puniceibacterium antarcticum]|uniref:NADP-dependent oxidoreductase domain-containing protein n=1 Tax=Puniceibacterium antarcticum TaxID=1206336 RepID=A0A2G8REJ2_9RHOB|nr:hypothetical protein P775_11985 [Puniceibacterium antarcticum]